MTITFVWLLLSLMILVHWHFSRQCHSLEFGMDPMHLSTCNFSGLNFAFFLQRLCELNPSRGMHKLGTYIKLVVKGSIDKQTLSVCGVAVKPCTLSFWTHLKKARWAWKARMRVPSQCMKPEAPSFTAETVIFTSKYPVCCALTVTNSREQESLTKFKIR